jgi:excisionase family DNA binding protein
VSIENAGRQALTVADAAARLAVHPKTVRRMLERGDLQRIRIGRAVRVDLASLDRFIAAGGDRPETDGEKADPIAKEQIKALNAKCAHLARLTDSTAGDVKAKAKQLAARHFGREIESTLDLSWGEADWVLDVLAGEIKRAS